MEESIVKLAVPFSEEVIHLSALDQQAQRHYAKPMLLFRVDHSGIGDPIVGHLKRALAVALCEAPDFAATVTPLPGSTRKELQLRLGPESGARWRVVDYTAEPMKERWAHGTFEELAARWFPLGAGAEVAPKELIPPEFLHVPKGAEELPALGVQVSMILGGVVVAFCWHHTVSDARGANVLLGAWAKHTRAFTLHGRADDAPSRVGEGEGAGGERWRLDHGTAPPAEVADLASCVGGDYKVDRAARSPPRREAEAHLMDREVPLGREFRITTWYFSAEALAELRAALAGEGVSAATTVEAVSALLWKAVSRVRLLHPGNGSDDDDDDRNGKDGTSLFTTRLEFRARLRPPLAGDFIGNVCEPNARTRVTLAEVCSDIAPGSLATLASAIRAATEAVDDAAVRRYVGVVNALPAVTDLTWDYHGFPGPDFGVTDLSGLDCFRTDWGPGLGGAPVCLRLAYREGGLLYLLPLDPRGGLEAQVLCEPEAAERMRHDEALGRYAVFRG